MQKETWNKIVNLKILPWFFLQTVVPNSLSKTHLCPPGFNLEGGEKT